MSFRKTYKYIISLTLYKRGMNYKKCDSYEFGCSLRTNEAGRRPCVVSLHQLGQGSSVTLRDTHGYQTHGENTVKMIGIMLLTNTLRQETV